MKATKLRDVHLGRPEAIQALYRLEPAMEVIRYDGDEERLVAFHYVIVSAIPDQAFSRIKQDPETYIFGASTNGQIIDWTELRGSFKGEMNHAKALNKAGYSIA